MGGALKNEIKQTRPFRIQEEVILALLRTADQLAAPMNEVLRQSGLSFSQYNVLRILRGAGAEGLPCGEISDRMVRRDPDLTRLLDRLESRDLVSRSRSTTDRRVVLATISSAGLELLESVDGPVDQVINATLAHMPKARLEELGELLEEARGAG